MGLSVCSTWQKLSSSSATFVPACREEPPPLNGSSRDTFRWWWVSRLNLLRERARSRAPEALQLSCLPRAAEGHSSVCRCSLTFSRVPVIFCLPPLNQCTSRNMPAPPPAPFPAVLTEHSVFSQLRWKTYISFSAQSRIVPVTAVCRCPTAGARAVDLPVGGKRRSCCPRIPGLRDSVWTARGTPWRLPVSRREVRAIRHSREPRAYTAYRARARPTSACVRSHASLSAERRAETWQRYSKPCRPKISNRNNVFS